MLNGELRHHQLNGVRWLISLYSSGRNGILSDELEADRQTQVVGFLAYLKSKGSSGPFLIASSGSSLSSWSSELQRLLPGVVVHTYSPSAGGREVLQHLCTPPAGDGTSVTPAVILVSHETFASARRQLLHHSFKHIVVDASGKEGSLGKLLAGLHGQTLPSVLLLTSENPAHSQPLEGLWPLLHLVLPDVWSAVQSAVTDMTELCDKAPSTDTAAASAKEHVIGQVKDLVDRFVLSRRADEVDISQPRRNTEINLYDYFANIDA